MNENNTKKQHSSQALGADSLENVSGGYSAINLPIVNKTVGLKLSDAERECLDNDLSWMKNLPTEISHEGYEQAKFNAQMACLKRHGFKQD